MSGAGTNAIELRPGPGSSAGQRYAPSADALAGAGALPLLRLDANEGADLPPTLLAKVLAAVAGCNAEALRSYPDAAGLRNALASRLRAEPSQVVATAGADDALERLCRAMLAGAQGARVLLHTPTFVMLPRYARAYGAVVDSVPWLGGAFPTEAFVEAIGPCTRVVFLVSPNNPTGQVVPRSAMEAVAVRCSEVGAALCVDGAYAEFAEEDPTAWCLATPGVVMTRTLSKAWGLAGLRVGYALGDARLVGWLADVGQPYAISALSLRTAEAALALAEGHLRETVAGVRRERDRLLVAAERASLTAVPSEANFVLLRDGGAVGDRRDGLWERLQAGSILGRRFSGDPALDGWVRLGITPDPAVTDRVIAALEAR